MGKETLADVPDDFPGDVAELHIKRSIFGLIDHCTAEFVFEGGDTAGWEVPCR